MLRELELKRSVCVLTVLNFTLKMAIRLKPWCPHDDDRVLLPTEYNRKTSGRENISVFACIHTHTHTHTHTHSAYNMRRFETALYRSQLLQNHS